MKVSHFKTLTGVLLALFFAASCDEPIDIPVNVNLGVSPKEVTIPADGGRATVSFNSPLAWEASSTADWLQISPASGEAGDNIVLTLSATANQSTDQRTANVTVKVKDYQFQETVKVIQTGAEPPFVPSLEVSPTSFTVEAIGGEISFTVTSNTDWTAKANANWLTLRTTSGKEGSTKVVAVASVNDAMEARSATVTVACAEISKTVKVDQKAAEQKDITAFRGGIQDWADGGEITISSGSQSQAKETEWSLYLLAEDKVIPMEKGADGLLTAKVQDHYSTMRMFFLKDGEEVFGSVYYSAYIPGEDGVYTVPLILTASSAHAAYVPWDGPVGVTLDPATLTATFTELPLEWKSLGTALFTDGFITYIWDVEMGEMEVEIEQNGSSQEYRIRNPYAALYAAYPEEFDYYPDEAELIFVIKEDNNVYFKETCTGFVLQEYGMAWAMSAVPEVGFNSYSYYGAWDSATATVTYTQPTVLYLEGTDRYYLTNNAGLMKIVFPKGN